MAPAQRADLFAETANRLDMPESLVEKDFWVCWVLKQLFSIKPFSGRFLFKGGTSLSKIFGAINRFSEDIDLAVDYTMLGFTGLRDPTRPDMSKTQRSKLLSEMLLECQRYIANEFRAGLEDRCAEFLGGGSGWSLEVDHRSERFLSVFGIPKLFGNGSPTWHLKLCWNLELTPNSSRETSSLSAPSQQPSFLISSRTPMCRDGPACQDEHSGRRRPFFTLNITGTRGSHFRKIFTPLLRFDVWPESREGRALADIELLAHVVRYKEAFYPSAWTQYATALPGSLRLVPPDSRVAAIEGGLSKYGCHDFRSPAKL